MADPAIMHQWLEERPMMERELAVRLVSEIDCMLGIDVQLNGDRIEGVASAFGVAIEREDRAELTRTLVTHLSTTGNIRGFVGDLAEILFLPRLQRSEYANHRLASPPWVMPKLLLEYATRSWRLDRLVGILTKDTCKNHCTRLPVGCCSILGYDLGLVPEGMLIAQRLEAKRNGWTAPSREEKCRYHGASGCTLALFKSPACVGYLCETLETDLAARYPAAELAELRARLAELRNCDLDRHHIFDVMDATIAAGERLGAFPFRTPASDWAPSRSGQRPVAG